MLARIAHLFATLVGALARLSSSLIIAVIVALLTICYLNARGDRRAAIARVMLYALGERPEPSPLDVQSEAHDWRTMSVRVRYTPNLRRSRAAQRRPQWTRFQAQ